MSKVVIQSEIIKQVGLSCYAESHRFGIKHYIETSEYLNGETKVKYKNLYQAEGLVNG